jgi:hypothetical protein
VENLCQKTPGVVCRFKTSSYLANESTLVILVCNRTIARSTVSIVVRHDFETEITKGYIFSEMTTMIHHALLGIPQQFQGLTHPLLVPSLIVELMLSAASGLQASIDDDLADIARATGFHDGEGYEFIGGLQDYRQISKDLGRVATRFAFAKSRILGIKATHEFCSRNLRSCESWIPEDKWDNYRESTRILLERSEYVASHIEHLLMYRCIEMRLQVQQSVVSTASMAVIPKQY